MHLLVRHPLIYYQRANQTLFILLSLLGYLTLIQHFTYFHSLLAFELSVVILFSISNVIQICLPSLLYILRVGQLICNQFLTLLSKAIYMELLTQL